jgi:predicted RNase H-like HicB family nuclease
MKKIRIFYHLLDGLWHFSSPDIERWIGGAKTLAEARVLAAEGVEFCLESKEFTIEEIFDPLASYLLD